MQIQVHYQGLETTQWAGQFIEDKISKLNRYLSPSTLLHVDVRVVNHQYSTTLSFHYSSHDYAFSSIGENLYEVISDVVSKANRVLAENKNIIKNKIHRRSSSHYEMVAS